MRISDWSSDVCSSDLHAQYLAFLGRARTEWLRAIGYGQELLRVDHGLVFAVRAMRIDFRAPARLDDALDVLVALRQRRPASPVIAEDIPRYGRTGRRRVGKEGVRTGRIRWGHV